MILDQPHERIDEPSAAAARDRHAALLHRDPDHLGHEARGRRVGPEAGVQHPRREQAVRPLGGEGLGQPVAAGDEHVAGEPRPRPAARAAAGAFSPRPEPVPRPQLGAEHAEGEVGVSGRTDSTAPAPLRRPSSAAFAPGRAEQEGGLAVREERALSGRSVFRYSSPRAPSSSPSSGVRRAADPERMPGAEDVVQVAGLGDLGCADRAAELVLALQHAHTSSRRARAAPRRRAS